MKNAEKTFKTDRKRADRYANLARKIQMRYKVRFPRTWKRRMCKKCKKFLTPGVNCRIRIYKKTIIITCLECNNVTRIGI